MSAKVVRFIPQRDRITREAAAKLAEQLRLFPEDQVPASARAQLLNALQRVTHPDTEHSIWPGGFSMLSRVQTAAVWDAIRALPSDARPNQVRHAFDLVLLNLRQDTGEVMLGRAELAEKIGCAPRSVSTIMGTLEKMGVIRRERRRIEGVQGRGEAVYFINPNVAWNGSLEIRKEEAKHTPPPLLTLMQGGAGD
jgi:CRP-like cAMP-binding protein